jgi:hypothetical protein
LTSFSARSTATFLLVAAAVLAAGATAEARVAGKVIAKGVLLKDGKTGYAQANASSPAGLSLSINAVPKQKVKMQWSVVCSNGVVATAANDAYDSSTAPKVGQSLVLTPGILKLPLPIAHPKSCSVTVYATLGTKGKETLEILQG